MSKEFNSNPSEVLNDILEKLENMEGGNEKDKLDISINATYLKELATDLLKEIDDLGKNCNAEARELRKQYKI